MPFYEFEVLKFLFNNLVNIDKINIFYLCIL